MLAFFRGIRRQLADDKQFWKYSRYAIGEIVLVVIGILIALQINTWNEARSFKKNERILLEELLESIQANRTMLQSSSSQLEKMNKSSTLILQVLKENIPYTDTLDVHFFWAAIRGDQRVNINRGAYEAYKNVGYDAIGSKTIQRNIASLYEAHYEQLNEWRMYLTGLAPYDHQFWTTHFLQYENGFSPINYGSLLSNESVQSYYYSVLRTRSVLEQFIRQCQMQSEAVIVLLEMEIKQG
jgi:hypothetical protein